jgi:protein TonB
MELTHWGVVAVDEERTRRLATGYAVGAGVFLILGLLAARFGDRPAEVVAEPEVEVKMVVRTEEAAPEPPPPPPPPPPAVRAPQGPAPVALGAPEASVPTEMPKDLPTARGPVQALEGVGDPNGVVGGAPLGEKKVEAPAPVVEAAPAPAVVEHGPTQLSEEDTPPELLEKPEPPKFPEEARAQGIEATVVIKFVVDEKGAVRDVRVLKGHPLFDALAVEWVKQWKYAPARDPEGHVKAVYRTTKIPFSLRG